jgi:hypothetical protein
MTNKASQPREHTPNQPKHESVLDTNTESWPLGSPGPGIEYLHVLKEARWAQEAAIQTSRID